MPPEAPISTALRKLRQREPQSDPLQERVRELEERLAAYELGWPPGHFYSPIPNLHEVSLREAELFREAPRELPGIDLREDDQLRLLDAFSRYYPEQPFRDTAQPGLHYYFDNPYFTYGEALALYGILRHASPRRVVEIGSGFSSCVILDTNQRFLEGRARCTFVEPHAERFLDLLTEEEARNVELLRQDLQTVETGLFEELGEGDVLFIDSTHVCKIGSDVQRIVFEILPSLRSGVWVHFHDIYYPFEYPKEWIYQGRAWNEAYVLRAFLQHNSEFEIQYFNSFLGRFHPDRLQACMPLAAMCPGSSLWLRKR